MIINLFRKFGLTRSEAILIIFFLILFSVGLIVPVFYKQDLPAFDYSVYDMKFEKSVSDAFNTLNNNQNNIINNTKFEKFITVKDSIELNYENQKGKNNNLNLITKVNINTASEKEFEQLPGIGPVIAGRIVSLREKTSKFKNIDEIMDVKGIGQKKFDVIKNYLTVE